MLESPNFESPIYWSRTAIGIQKLVMIVLD